MLKRVANGGFNDLFSPLNTDGFEGNDDVHDIAIHLALTGCVATLKPSDDLINNLLLLCRQNKHVHWFAEGDYLILVNIDHIAVYEEV